MKQQVKISKIKGNPPEQDIQKAINHLHFELDKLYKKSTIKTGGLVE